MHMRHSPPHVGHLLLILTLLAAVETHAAVDLAGTWRDETSGALVTITQVGDVVTIDGMSGIVTAPGPFGLESPIPPPPCATSAGMRLLPGEGVIDGRKIRLCSPPFGSSITRLLLTRCECDDGNAMDGDGCDARCRVEPCFSCAGAPSVCTPEADGATCDDRLDCTTGETCTAGVCGDATTVAGCTDINGAWSIVETVPDVGSVDDYTAIVSHRDGVLMVRDGSAVRWVGTYDPMTGAMDVAEPNLQILCNDPDGFSTTVTAGRFTGTGEAGVMTANECVRHPLTVAGSRCGDGVLQSSESCDDGGTVGGDGCTATCETERCWSCDGTPSTCTPIADGTSCDDGDACSENDVCTGGACAGGAAVACGACLGCDSASGCVPSPRQDCRAPLKPRKAGLQVVDRSTNTKDVVKWKWPTGAATTGAELGDPTAGSGVTFCVFDESGTTPTLAFRATVPAGGTCGSRPCWKATGGGYRFTNDAATGDGIRSLTMHAGAAGKARMTLAGKGAGLSGRAAGLPAPPLGLPLRAQLQVDGGACFETRHAPAGVRENAAGVFKARGTP